MERSEFMEYVRDNFYMDERVGWSMFENCFDFIRNHGGTFEDRLAMAKKLFDSAMDFNADEISMIASIPNEQPSPIKHGNYLIVWLDKFDCWCIYDESGNKVREPLWATSYEARQAIDSGEAL